MRARRPILALLTALLAAASLPATVVLRLSFDELVAEADSIVHGKVEESWTAWDDARTTIWTHYRIRTAATLKGEAAATLVVSEPGGELDGIKMEIAGTPEYEVGQEVVVFTEPTPIGYVRTRGWGQGRFRVQSNAKSPSGKSVQRDLYGIQLAEKPWATSLQAVEVPLAGDDLEAFLARIRQAVGQTSAVESQP